MRAVVIGGSGQIGGWLLEHLRARGHQAVGTYAEHPYDGLQRLDAADLESSRRWLEAQRPDVVFYPAGFTWVDGCERDPARARAANVEQPLNLARAAAGQGARFVYFSTDYVFDGEAGPYDEDAATRPLSEYGRSKLEAEQALQRELGDRQLTLRTSWVYGPERQGKNFSYQLVKALRAGQELPTPSDMLSNPSYGPDVAQAAVQLAERGQAGLLHLAGPEILARDVFARTVAQGFGLDPARIVSRPTAALGQGAPRPLRGGLRTDRLERILPGLMRPISGALAHFRQAVAEPGAPWADPMRS